MHIVNSDAIYGIKNCSQEEPFIPLTTDLVSTTTFALEKNICMRARRSLRICFYKRKYPSLSFAACFSFSLFTIPACMHPIILNMIAQKS